ncbi:MAG: hypothetical protein PVH18_04075 [Chloroflexota bacterium]
MVRRAIGVVLILVGLTGLMICYFGAKAGRAFVDEVALSADDLSKTASSSLVTIEDSLEQARQTLTSVTQTIGQVRSTSSDLAMTIDDTQPTLDEMALLVGTDIPDTISDVQETIPNIAQTAKVVDDTLRLLSRLQVEQTVPLINYEISFGLGVDYNPEIPFDQAVEEVGRGLEPIAVASGNLEEDLQTAKSNMATLSQDLNVLAGNLDTLQDEVTEFRPLLDEYSTLAEDMQDGIASGRVRIDEQSMAVRRGIILAAVWLGLFQLMPLYFGLELAAGNRMVRQSDAANASGQSADATQNTAHDNVFRANVDDS